MKRGTIFAQSGAGAQSGAVGLCQMKRNQGHFWFKVAGPLQMLNACTHFAALQIEYPQQMIGIADKAIQFKGPPRLDNRQINIAPIGVGPGDQREQLWGSCATGGNVAVQIKDEFDCACIEPRPPLLHEGGWIGRGDRWG